MNKLPFSLHVGLVLILGSSACMDLASAGADAEEPAARLLVRAIDQYEKAMEADTRDARVRGFVVAEQLFRQAIEAQPPGARSPNVYVNLGNAALQAENIGPAILAFRRALELDPTNIQAQQNLRFARLVGPENLRRESNGGLVSTLFFWNAMYSRGQIGGLAAMSFFFAAALFAVGFALRQPLLRNLAVIPTVAWCVCLLSMSLAEGPREASSAVIVAAEVVLRSADSENAPPRLSEMLPSGVEVRILRTRERWTEIEIPGGRTGWVLSSAVENL